MEDQQPTRIRGDEPGIRSVERALRLVTVIAEASNGIGLADASRAVGLAPSTATRILRTLEATGFAARRDDGTYSAGTELIRLGARHTAESPLIAAAQTHLDNLARSTGESCYLAIPIDDEWATYVRMAQSTHSVRHVSWLGRRIPRASSAVGAALAGRVNDAGVAMVVNGVEPGTTAVALPLRERGAIVAVINVVGPSFRMTAATRRAIIQATCVAGRALAPHRACAA